MASGYEEFDLSAVKTYPLSSRTSKARVEDFARPHRKGAPFSDFLAGLPGILAASDLSAVVSAVTSARRAGAGIVWGLGAHVVKTGLSPVIVDLMERGFVTAVATNGGRNHPRLRGRALGCHL
jgi:deoxyhypusine synthase